MTLVLVAHAYRFLLLPDEDVVHHGTAAEHDAKADQHAGDDGRRGMELSERVQDNAYGNECLVRDRTNTNAMPTDSPVRNMGMEMKKPPTAHTRLTLDFCRYLLPLKPDQ